MTDPINPYPGTMRTHKVEGDPDALLLSFLRRYLRMRDAQRNYFTNRTTRALQASKELEAALDRAVKGYLDAHDPDRSSDGEQQKLL